jgi:hypothetical protein
VDYKKHWRTLSRKEYRLAHQSVVWASETLPEYAGFWLDQAEYHRAQARKYAAWGRGS